MRALNFVLFAALGASACGEMHAHDSGNNGPVTIDLGVSGLEDVNATSASFGQDLHPNDFTGQTTAWYFGHST